MTRYQQPKSETTGQAAALIEKYITGAARRNLIRTALEEDIGTGDLTSCIFPPSQKGKAILLAKADGVLSGIELVDEVFRQLHKNSRVAWRVTAGKAFKSGDILAEITGHMRVLLLGERVA